MTRPEPTSIPIRFAEAWNQRDARALADLFVEDAEFVNVTGLWWHNQQAIYKAHEYGLRVIFPDSNLSIIRTKVRYLADDVAVVHAKFSLTEQSAPEPGLKPHGRSTILVFVVKWEGDDWKCHTAQNTDIIPGMETWVADDQGGLKAVNYGQFKSQ